MTAGPALLSVHAVDGPGHRGVGVDAATWLALGCRPLTVVTSVLTVGSADVVGVESLDAGSIGRQLEAVERFRPHVTRTGMVGGPEQIACIARWLADGLGGAVVVAPVLAAEGASFEDPATLDAIRDRLLPLARVLVLRAGDVRRVLGRTLSGLEQAALAAGELRAAGARSVLLTGVRQGDRVVDVLDDAGREVLFDVGRIAAPKIQGLDDVHAAALAAHLALGAPIDRAAQAAQRHVASRLVASC